MLLSDDALAAAYTLERQIMLMHLHIGYIDPEVTLEMQSCPSVKQYELKAGYLS